MYRRNAFTAAVKTANKVLPNSLVDVSYSSPEINTKIHVFVSNKAFRRWSSVQYRYVKFLVGLWYRADNF